MKTNTSLLVLLLSGFVMACTAPQKPVHFAIQSNSDEALPKVRALLAQNGHETESMDPQAGIIHTRWVDTGFMMGQVQGQTATILRRYTVTMVTMADGKSNLTLRADTKKCAQGGFEIGGEMVTGACEVMSELAPAHQQELDALGAQLSSQAI
jgi:hypothetical protein